MTKQQMILVAFMQASNCSNYPASWRHPHTASGFMTADYYQNIARVLEAGKFHLAFFDDRLAMPSQYQGSYEEAVRHGIRVVKMDLVPLMTAMAMATTHLGLGATYSTTYYPPFHIARLFATLDHLSGGRVAWNVVTSLNDAEAQNYGLQRHMAHDARYDVADEFLEVVYGLWDTWEDDALVLDRAQGYFADPAKVHWLDYQGQWYQAKGPLTVPRSPQGYPVVIQAGQSSRGRDFAARWGELIFVIFPSIEVGKAAYDDVKTRAANLGRNPDHLKIAPAVYAVVGETEAMAQEKLAYIESLADATDSLVLLTEVFNYDFGQHDLDEPLSQEAMDSMSGIRSFLERVIQGSGKANPTLRDFMAYTGRGTLRELPRFVGTPSQVADQMEAWLRGGACDGFVLAATHMPGAYEDFVRLVVPELQRRHLFQTDYAGRTLRENLGIPYPEWGTARSK
ncbi:MAG: monooxygenase [Candidatus Entotheonella factor]|uniref:Monooxygenase n=1 Tax=Entotheonella factor TaxID=1429438 RepID=W4LST6_ENTF1|nr:MAG: monooxygenase [Candidatus Entotheonella factor]